MIKNLADFEAFEFVPDQMGFRAAFDAFTYMDKPTARAIKDTLMPHRCIAAIDYDEEWGIWCFHTMYPPDGTVSIRPDLARRFDHLYTRSKSSQGRIGTEADVERSICEALDACGIAYRRQLWCDAGIADIVTADAVVEVEYRLSRAKMFEAVGQTTLYRQAIDPKARAVIIGLFIGEDAKHLVPVANDAGVEVYVWPGKREAQQAKARAIFDRPPAASRLHNVSQVCGLLLDSLTDYEQDTGDYGGSHEVRKWMRHMRKTIQRHLDAYGGK